MFLNELPLDKNMLILLLSIAFVVVIILIWFIVAKIVKSVKTDKYYKQLAKEELASLGCEEFKKESVKPEELDSTLNDKEENDKILKEVEASNDNENGIAPVMIENEEAEASNCSTDEEIDAIDVIISDDEEELIKPIISDDEFEETLAEEAIAMESLVLENKVDENPVEELPVLETEEKEDSVEELPVLENKVDENPVEELPVSENKVDEDSVDELPVLETEGKEDSVEDLSVLETEEKEEPTVEKTNEDLETSEETDIKPTIEAKPEIKEEPKKKKGRTYNGKYEIYQTADGYAYNLKASNGEILVTSETYTTRDGVLKAINAVKRNLENGEVRIFADKRGQYKFKLISRNYRILAISSNYSVEKSAIRASESFKKFALKADIVDVEVVDADINTANPIEIGILDDKNDGKFVVEKYNGEFSWALKASNGQILCQAEGYTSKAGCMYSIETFKRNVSEGTFKTVKDKMGNFLFKLYNVSGRICAVGESYSTKQRAEDAARSVVSFYKNANVIELKETKEKDTKSKK